MTSLRELRLARGLSQAALAQALGCSMITVWNWENKSTHPQQEAKEALAAFFEVPLDEIEFAPLKRGGRKMGDRILKGVPS
jgi:transcriptional regulator with XRE-family HTH domain